MVDGAKFQLKKIDSNDLLFLEDRRPQITFDPYIRSFHSIFNTTKERRFPSPGFEPTTFLIQVNTHKRVFTPKTTVPWPICFLIYLSPIKELNKYAKAV